jgi:WD40 repeat protein
MKDYVSEQNNDDCIRDFELSHIIGLNTNMEKCIQGHPSMPDSLIYSVGGIIVVEDLNDRNNQVYFRHGRNQIGAFKISNNGKFLGVGFVSDNLEKSIPTSVILWNFETKEVIYELSGILKGVNIIEFSQDDQYIAAAGLDNSIYIWQLETGYKCFHRTFEFSINLLQWTYIFMTGSGDNNANSSNNFEEAANIQNHNSNNSKNTEYYLTIANVNVIHYVRFYYDFNSMQYYTNFNKFNLPSTGYNRIYTSSFVDLENRTLFMGTSGGELSSFNLDNLYFKTSYNVINNGVTSLLFAPEGNGNSGNSHCVIIGGGDGRVKKMVFSEGKQMLTHEIHLSSRVLALTQGTDAREFYAATKNGEIFRVLAEDFTYTLHSNSHVVSVNSAVYFRGRNDICFVCDDLVIRFFKNQIKNNYKNAFKYYNVGL